MGTAFWLGRLRLISGLILMAFVTTHLINHTLGLISIEAAEAGRLIFLGFWRSPVISEIFAASLILHMLLALVKLFSRDTLKMSFWEVSQLVLGLAIPILLTIHLLGTGILHRCCGVDDTYVYEINILWPNGVLRQTVLTLIIWLHGCIGIHFWLRTRRGYRRLFPWLLAFAVLLPTLSLLGFVQLGRFVEAIPQEQLAIFAEEQNWPTREESKPIYQAERIIVRAFIALVVLTIILRLVWRYIKYRRNTICISYDNGKTVRSPRGISVLGASKLNGIPHASVCGGRGRCSTCRIKVNDGLDHLPLASVDERSVLDRFSGQGDIRLACQLHPVSDLAIERLLPVSEKGKGAIERLDRSQGREREIAVLFADLRSFTRFSEGRLPFDVVFVLNRYFEAMGEAIEGTGGYVDKFIGDGIMALFGVSGSKKQAASQALMAAYAMNQRLDALNNELGADLNEPLRMGIGIHLGPAIVGEMGYGRSTALTAIGDTVNVASRLESSSKEFAAQLVVSAAVVKASKISGSLGDQREVEVRGRRTPLKVHVVEKISANNALSDLVQQQTSTRRWSSLLQRRFQFGRIAKPNA